MLSLIFLLSLLCLLVVVGPCKLTAFVIQIRECVFLRLFMLVCFGICCFGSWSSSRSCCLTGYNGSFHWQISVVDVAGFVTKRWGIFHTFLLRFGCANICWVCAISPFLPGIFVWCVFLSPCCVAMSLRRGGTSCCIRVRLVVVVIDVCHFYFFWCLWLVGGFLGGNSRHVVSMNLSGGDLVADFGVSFFFVLFIYVCSVFWFLRNS